MIQWYIYIYYYYYYILWFYGWCGRKVRKESLYLGETFLGIKNPGTFSRRELSHPAGRSSATFPAKEKSHFSAGHGECPSGSRSCTVGVRLDGEERDQKMVFHNAHIYIYKHIYIYIHIFIYIYIIIIYIYISLYFQTPGIAKGRSACQCCYEIGSRMIMDDLGRLNDNMPSRETGGSLPFLLRGSRI